jgi:hypothetical protein
VPARARAHEFGQQKQHLLKISPFVPMINLSTWIFLATADLNLFSVFERQFCSACELSSNELLSI